MSENQTPTEIADNLTASAPLPEFITNPTLSGDRPGQPLYEALKTILPPDVPIERLNYGFTCYGYARIIATYLGGPNKAKIYEVRRIYPNEVDAYNHAYVVPNDAIGSDLALNNYLLKLTVEEVLKEGTDVTEETFDTPWDKL